MRIVPTYDRDADIAYVLFGAERPVAVTIAPIDDLAIDLDDEGHVVGIEFVTASRRLDPSTLEDAWRDELLGVSQLAEILGKKKQNIAQHYTRRSDFPRPAVQLPTGRYWRRADIENWMRHAGVRSSAARRAAAAEWLTGFLSAGERRLGEIRSAAREAGVAWADVSGAGMAIEVERHRERGRIVWALPVGHPALAGTERRQAIEPS